MSRNTRTIAAIASLALTGSLLAVSSPAEAGRTITTDGRTHAASASFLLPLAVGTASSNEGRNDPKSKAALYAYSKSGKVTTVRKGQYLPNGTKKIATPRGYKATAWFPGRGQWCIDSDRHTIPVINRTWRVVTGNCGS